MEESIARAAEWLREAHAVVVVTGAGVSAESEIPTFRDSMEALWAEFDPQTLATPEAFEADPETVTKWYDWRRMRCAEAEPNPGHVALARMEREIAKRGGVFTLLTQNVDGLHARAGTHNLVELHGSLRVWRCTVTRKERVPDPEPFPEYPVRTDAGGYLRPGVVWFGESLPERALKVAFGASASCDLFFSVGTSAVVYPAAGFVELAKSAGARCIEVNRDPTPATELVDLALHGKSGEILPRIVDAAFGQSDE